MTPDGVQAVDIPVGADVCLRGHYWPGAATWIVLLHDVGDDEDLDCWQPLVPSLLNRGWSVLAVDLRGHGASDGEWEPGLVNHDLQTITAFARSNGAGTLCLVAAGQTTVAALQSASGITVEALVLLSPVIDEATATAPFRGAGEAKLILCGGANPAQRRSAERLRNASIGWAAILNLPATEEGAALLGGACGSHAKEHIVGFLAEQDFVARNRSMRRIAH
jgi:pimeloyl-ACP methyl ester carboxylesterase